MNRNKRIAIAACSVVAVAGVGCGTNHDQILSMLKNGEEITIEYAEQKDSTTKECIEQHWQTLSTYETNSTFRSTFEHLTNNEEQEDGTKRGTIYYLDNPTLSTTLCNTAFISYFEALTKEELSSMLSEVYVDVNEASGLETLRSAALNEYFKLFNSKEAGSYNSTQKVSRQDFLAALSKATISPTSEQEGLSESEIANLVSTNSYIGENSTNNTETGKITKIEAAYLLANTLFKEELSAVSSEGELLSGLKSAGNIAKANKYDKTGADTENVRVATLQKCLESNELDNELYKSLKVLEEKGIISAEFENAWNKSITKDESINLIYKALIKVGESTSVSSDIIAEELASVKSAGIDKINSLSRVDIEAYVEQINASENIEEVEGLIASAESEESAVIAEEQRQAEEAAKKEAEEAAARKAAEQREQQSDSLSGFSGRVLSGGGGNGGSSSGNGGSTNSKDLGDRSMFHDEHHELEEYDGDIELHLK